MSLVEDLIGRIRKDRKRIVIVGDAVNDVWIDVTEGECQEGCPKLTTSDACRSPGGAANAHQCIRNWSVDTDLFTYPDNVWPVKYRFTSPDGRAIFRWDDERSVRDADRNGFAWKYRVDRAMEMVRCAAGVLLSDYDKGFLTREMVNRIIEMCARRGVPCVADAKRAPQVYRGAILKCNSNYQARYNQELSKLVYDASDGQPLVVTDGPLSPAVWCDGNIQKGFPFLPPVPCVNHVGAGDCFAAHLTLALAYGFGLKDAAVIAHSAGRCYVQHPHNRPPLPEEVVGDTLY